MTINLRIVPLGFALALCAGCSWGTDVDNGPVEARACSSDTDCATGVTCNTAVGYCRGPGAGGTVVDATTGTNDATGMDAAMDATECLAPQEVCGGACVNTQTNATHCGGCDIVCGAGESCVGGVCECTAGSTCDGACVDLNTDSSHCGACGVSCATNAICVAAQCRCPGGNGDRGCPSDLPGTESVACAGPGSKDCTLTCSAGFTDDNSLYEDGCEVMQ